MYWIEFSNSHHTHSRIIAILVKYFHQTTILGPISDVLKYLIHVYGQNQLVIFVSKKYWFYQFFRSFNPGSIHVYVWFGKTQSLTKCIWQSAISQHQFYLDRKQVNIYWSIICLEESWDILQKYHSCDRQKLGELLIDPERSKSWLTIGLA